MTSYSLYLHIPFCRHRCAYCDFNTYAGQEDLIPSYVAALISEIETVAASTPGALNVHTAFFGGGTPSLLSAAQIGSIMDALRAGFHFTANAEISMEANPGTVSTGSLKAIYKAGINRLSFGVQSANSEELRMLEREHSFFDVIEAVSAARAAGFENLNLDIIYGLPEQSLETWRRTLNRILGLKPEHISAYALTLEHGTPFGRWSARGLMPLLDPDLAAQMYEYAEEFLAGRGYAHYEISNWAIDRGQKTEGGKSAAALMRHPSMACRHNLQYWRGLPYLAFGAGAHGYAGGYRYSNVLRIKSYIDRFAGLEPDPRTMVFPLSPASINQRLQSREDDMSDYMITNLRLVRAGVSGSDFRSRFGCGLEEVYPTEVVELIHAGLLENKTSEGSEVFRLTKRGRLLGNQVFMRFVGT